MAKVQHASEAINSISDDSRAVLNECITILQCAARIRSIASFKDHDETATSEIYEACEKLLADFACVVFLDAESH